MMCVDERDPSLRWGDGLKVGSLIQRDSGKTILCPRRCSPPQPLLWRGGAYVGV